jgi:hypothetical protein
MTARPRFIRAGLGLEWETIIPEDVQAHNSDSHTAPAEQERAPYRHGRHGP